MMIDPKPLRDFLIEKKEKTLEQERRATGIAKDVLGVQIRTIEAFLIFLASKMEEGDMGTLKLRLDEAAIPTGELKRKAREGEELRQFLVEAAKKVPKGFSKKIEGLGDAGIKPDSLASKMWAMRERNELPMQFVPVLQTDPETKEKSVWISHKTSDELAKMRKGRGTARSN